MLLAVGSCVCFPVKLLCLHGNKYHKRIARGARCVMRLLFAGVTALEFRQDRTCPAGMSDV